MADVNATFNYDANFGSALSQIKALSKELSFLNNSFNSLDKNARVLRNDLANTFTSAAGQIGGFSAKTVTITSDMDNFGKALDRSKLKLRDYAREASRAFSANSNARKLAEDQVRRTKGQLVELGMDAEGRRKGILVTPMRLDMTDMNNQLQVARKQFDIFNRLIQDGATSLINWGKNTQWAGRQLTVGLTVPMTIFASTTIKAFNDVDRELTRFQKVYGSDLVGATTQATNEIRQQIQLLAIDIASKYGVAAKETAALAADLAATGLEGKKLTDSIKETTRLAVLGELDRQDAMATTLSLQNAFNMSTKELSESIDFLNAVENQTSVSLQDLTVAIPKVGPVIESLGGDVKDLSVLLVAMKEGGINAAEGANALKSGLASLINPTKSASAIAKQYGIDLQGIVTRNKGQLMPTLLEFQSSLQTIDDFGKAKIIEQLFGKYQFARISALFDNLNAQGSQTVEVMKLMGASSAELAAIADGEIKTLTESTSMRFQRAMEGIKASLLPVGETITRSVIPFMEKFAEIMGKIVEFGKGLPEPVKNFLKFTAGITAVAGPLVMITGVLANFMGYITKGAMGFVNLGRRMAGLPTKQFSLFDDQQIAAAKATDTVTVSIQNQGIAMGRLVKLMKDYNATLIAQRSLTPGAFSQTPLVSNPRSGGPRGGSPIRRQKGGGAYVPGSGSGDKVKALLEPGEFVVNREATKQYGGLLEDINNGVPRFQSGGVLKARFGVRVPKYAVATGPGPFRRREPEPTPIRQAKRQRPPELMDFKDWNPRQVSALSAGENLLMNNLFIRANSSSTIRARDSVLKRIQDDSTLSLDDKRIISNTLASGQNIKDLTLQKEFGRILKNGYDSGDFDDLSSALKAQIITTIELASLRTRQSKTYSEVNPMLTETIRKTREEFGTKIRTRPKEWSKEDTSKSFYSAFSSKDDVATAYTKVVQTLKDSGVSDFEAERLANLYVYGIKRNTSAESFQASHQFGGVIKAQRGIKVAKPNLSKAKANTFKDYIKNEYDPNMSYADNFAFYNMNKSYPQKDWNKPLTKEQNQLFNPWIDEKQELRKIRSRQSSDFINEMSPLPKGMPLDRATTLNPGKSNEFPLDQQIMLIEAIKSGNLQSVIGKEITFNSFKSFSRADAGYKGSFGFFRGPKKSVGISAFHELNKSKRKSRNEKPSEYGLEDIFIKYITSGKTIGKDITRDMGGGSLNEVIASNLKGKIVSVASNAITGKPTFIIKGMQNGGPIRAMRGIKMPDAYATKLSTVKQSMSAANAEAMASKLPIADLGTRQSRIGGFSSAIPGVNGVYEIGGKRYVVKGHDTEESALAEANMARITRDVFGLKTPNQEVVRVKHPETGDLLFAVRSPYDEAFAKSTGRFTEDSAFDQLVASVARRDKDLQADNLFDNIVSDVGQAGIMSKASQPRTKTGPTNSALEQLAINLGMTKGGARSHGAEAWNAATANMTDAQIIARIKESAAKAKAKLSSSDIPEDFKYIAKDLDDIASADLAPFVAHLRTVFPKEKKPPTAAALAKKEQQKILDREERQSAISAGFPEWALQKGGSPFVPGSGEGDRVPALLEPGEFVVNKKAAKQYGGLLHDINFNQAPRFQAGGMPGMKTGAVGGALLSASFLLPMVGVSEKIQTLVLTIGTLTSVISALSVVVTKNTAAQAAGGAGSLFQRGAQKRAIGKQMIAGSGTAASRRGIGAGAGRLAGGVGKFAMGALMSGPGLIAVAGVVAVTAAVIAYKKEVNEAKKAAEEAFKVGEKTAQEYGYELTKVNDKIKENAQLTKNLGIGFTEAPVSTIVSEEKRVAIAEDNKNLIKDLQEKESGFNKDTKSIEAQLLNKYATLRQQGVTVEDANEIVTTIARETGDETLSILSNIRPQLEKMNGDNINEVFKAAQEVQLNSLKNMKTSGTGGGEAFAEALLASVSVVQYAPPEDQLEALNNLITNMQNFNPDKVILAAEALKTLAAETYGTESEMGSALDQLFSKTDEKGYLKTDEKQQSDLVLGQRIMSAEQLGSLNASQQKIIQVALKSGTEEDLARIDAILDEVEEDRDVKINIAIENQKAAEAAIAEIDKEIAAQQAKFDGQMIANDNAVESENKRYENAQKAHEKFIKQKQKEIEAINKSADAYIKALQDEQKADDFAQQQRDTALGGLKALASGDVFGFVQSQQDMAGAAQQFGFESEIKAIDERRQAAVDAKQEEIEKTQELAATEDERHQNRLKALENQRSAIAAAHSTEMKSLQEQKDAFATLGTMAGGAFDKMMDGYSKTAQEAGKVLAVEAALEALSEGKTVAEAIAVGRQYMKDTYGVGAKSGGGENMGPGGTGSNQTVTRNASGGYISGAGGPKADLIPARLSNGEYVVQASAVDAYGVGMMDSINEQRFADGGLVDLNTRRPGKQLGDPSTKTKVAIAEKEWGETFDIMKGGYLKADKYSGKTHTGGGVFDAFYGGGSKLFPVEAVKALRKAGFAAWNRWQFGDNNRHIHAIEIGSKTLSKSAKNQVSDYLRGGDGMGGKDTLSNKYDIPDISGSTAPDEVAPNLDRIATAMDTTVDIYNKVKNEGAISLLGRRFGGSMTMNKPYMVGENGPEVVMPYGSGGRVVPIKYNVPAMASGGIINGGMGSASPQINVTVNGVNDPKQAADRAAQLINSEMNRRKFSRSIV